MVETLILGSLYRLTLAKIKKQKTTLRDKTYNRPAISVSREDLEGILGEREGGSLCYSLP